MGKRLTSDQIKKRIENLGFKFVSYSFPNFSYKCICGTEITKNKLNNISGCRTCAVQNRKQTMLKKYGLEYPMQIADIKNKRKTTCLDRYGVDYIFQHDKIKEQIKATYLANFGVDHPMQNAKVREKAKKISLSARGKRLQDLKIIN